MERLADRTTAFVASSLAYHVSWFGAAKAERYPPELIELNLQAEPLKVDMIFQ